MRPAAAAAGLMARIAGSRSFPVVGSALFDEQPAVLLAKLGEKFVCRKCCGSLKSERTETHVKVGVEMSASAGGRGPLAGRAEPPGSDLRSALSAPVGL